MTIGINALIDRVASHAAASGHFAVIHNHEPKSLPSNGPGSDLTFAVFLSSLGPARSGSGLSATTARVELTGRIYMPFMSQPENLIDPRLAEACDDLFEAYTSDFDLGGSARNVDVLGAQGRPLAATAGYQTIDKATYRAIDIVIPIVINDAWNQGD